jgi:hypothetical protein
MAIAAVRASSRIKDRYLPTLPDMKCAALLAAQTFVRHTKSKPTNKHSACTA